MKIVSNGNHYNHLLLLLLCRSNAAFHYYDLDMHIKLYHTDRTSVDCCGCIVTTLVASKRAEKTMHTIQHMAFCGNSHPIICICVCKPANAMNCNCSTTFVFFIFEYRYKLYHYLCGIGVDSLEINVEINMSLPNNNKKLFIFFHQNSI